MPSRPPTHHLAPRTPRPDHRPSASARGYSRSWQSASRAFLDSNPLCVECLQHGLTAAATDVDHITPHRGDPTLFWDETNWQPLCHSHHSRKTRRGQ